MPRSKVTHIAEANSQNPSKKNNANQNHPRQTHPLPRRHHHLSRLLYSRLEPNPRLQPRLAPSRQIPQWPNHVHGPVSRPPHSLLHLAADPRPQGLALHRRAAGEPILDNGDERHPVPRHDVDGSRVWRGRAAEGAFRRASRAAVGGLCGWMRGIEASYSRRWTWERRLLVLVVDAGKQGYGSSRRE